MNNINFWTGKNYLKRDTSTTTVSLAAPVTAYGGSGYYRTTLTVVHSLGYIPLFRVYYQPFKDGVIYAAQGSRQSAAVQKIDGTSNFGPICLGSPTSTTLVLEIGYFTNTLTGTYPVEFVIYKDYQL